MRPDGPEALDNFLSGDSERVYQAVRTVMAGYDDEVLRFLSLHADRIEAATKTVDLGGAIVSNRRYLAQSIRRLRAVEAGDCLCTLLQDYGLSLPGSESRAGLIEILAETEPEPYVVSYHCRCRHCGQEYLATESHGWHMPTCGWKALAP
jgi:hypothetical protein